jgi:hypothetical protein
MAARIARQPHHLDDPAPNVDHKQYVVVDQTHHRKHLDGEEVLKCGPRSWRTKPQENLQQEQTTR